MADEPKADKFDGDIEGMLDDALDIEFDDDALDAILATGLETVPVEPVEDVDEAGIAAYAEQKSDRNDLGDSRSADENETDEVSGFAPNLGFEAKTDGGEDAALHDHDLESLEQQIARATQELVTQQQTDNIEASEIQDGDGNESVSGDDGVMAESTQKKSADDERLNVQPGYEGRASSSLTVSLSKSHADKQQGRLIVARKLGEPLPDDKTSSSSPVDKGDGRNEAGADDIFAGGRLDYADREQTTGEEEGGETGQKNWSKPVALPRSASLSTRKRRGFSSYWATTALSLLWASGGVATGMGLAPDGFSTMEAATSFLTGATGMLVTAGTVVPIAMFWGFAQLARRARELKHVVDDMTDAALRLLEPESEAETRVASLGSVIRHEVEAMGDGIERTMSRASELEALLQNEVNNLEQAYGENETRIRALIVELANEREAVSTHADHVKNTIGGAKDQLTQEFNSIADHINATAESFTSALSETLNARWGELVNEFNMANEDVAQQLSKKFIETVQSFDASRGRFFEELDSRFAQIDQHTEEASKAVAERLGGKMDNFVKIVQDRTEDVEGRFNTLTGRLAHSGEKIIEAVNESVAGIENRSAAIDNRLRSTADKVLGDFESKFDHLDREISARGARSLSAFGEHVSRLEKRATDLPASFDKVTEKAVDEFATHIARVEEQFTLLSGRLAKSGANITDAIENSLSDIEERSDDVDTRLQRTTNRLLDEFEKKFEQVDKVVAARGSGSLERFGEQIQKIEQRAGDLTSNFDVATNLAIQAFEKRLNQVDESLNEHSTSLIRSFIARTESLEESTDKLNIALDVHVGRINEAFQQRTRDIAQTLTGGRDGILSVVEETKVRLSHEMEIVGTTIARLVDERAGGFIHQFTEGREKLSNTLENETQRIVETVSSQIEILSRHVSDIEHGLTRNIVALDAKASAQIEALDDRTASFEKSVTRNFDTAREVIETQAKNLDARGDALRDSLALNSQTLSGVLNEQAEVLEERIARIRALIAEGNVSFTDVLGQHVTLVEEAVSSNGEALKATFLQHLHNLENQTARLKDTFTDSQDALALSLDERIERFRDSLYSSQASIEATLANHGQLVSDRAGALQNTLVDNLGRVQQGLESSLMEAQTSLVGRVSGAQISLVDSLGTMRDDLTGAIAQSQASLTDNLKMVQGEIVHGVERVERDLVEAMTASQERLVTTLSSADENLAQTVDKADAKLVQTLSTVDARLARALTTVDEKLEYQGRLLDKRAINLRDAVDHNNEVLEKTFETQTAIIDERTVTMQKAIEVGVTNVRSALEQNAVSLSETLRERIAEVSHSLSHESQRAETLINAAGDQLSQNVLKSVSDVERRLTERVIYLRDSMNEIGGQIDNDMSSIVKRVASTASSLTDEAQKAETIISSAGLRLAGSVLKSAESVEQRFVERDALLKNNVSEIEESITSGLDAIGERMTLSVTSFAQEAQKVGSEINDGLDRVNSRMSDAAASLSHEVANIESRITAGLDQIGERVAGAASSLNEEARRAEGMITFAGERLAGSVLHAAETVEQKLSDRAVFLKENVNLIEERISSGLNSIEGRISEITQKTASQLVHKTQDLQGLTEKLHDAATRTSDSLGSLTSQFSEQLQDVTRAAEARLRSENDNFINNFSSQSAATVDAVRVIKTNISDSIAQLLDRLDTSNGTIQLTVNALRSSVSEVDERLGGMTAEFRQNIGQLAESFTANSQSLNRDLQHFNGLSQNAVTSIESFSQQFDNHARILSEATNLLDSSHGIFAEKIEERQNALNQLAQGLVTKSEEISKAVQGCEQIISAIMRRTEENARASSSQIQFSLTEMITEASSRFEGATEDIRKSAEEIREELARTRADLSRGVRTLPSQTKEYTEAMRKAVTDQIDALKELSTIVEESGRFFDVSQPVGRAGNTAVPLGLSGLGSGFDSDDISGSMPRFVTRAARPDLAPATSTPLPAGNPDSASTASLATGSFTAGITSAKPVGGARGITGNGTASIRSTTQPATSYFTNPAFSQTATSPQTAAAPISQAIPARHIPSRQNGEVDVRPRPVAHSVSVPTVGVTGQPQVAAASKIEQQQEREGQIAPSISSVASPAASVAPAASSSRSGWVSDLLARASRDDFDGDKVEVGSRTVESSGDTLNSMSSDIVKGIDHEEIVQLWQHYRRGQRNINASKLYTEEGARTFEKIKHKYALDGEFRRAVSQYITDFERLLSDVSKNGGNNNTMREYLASETGKVYTMLAHASGRIQ